MILKFIWKWKRPKIVKTKKENEIGGFTLSDFKTFYKAAVIMTVYF
jgi:hypothetical protein